MADEYASLKAYKAELNMLSKCETLTESFRKAIDGLKVTIGGKKTTDDSLRDIARSMRYSISEIDKMVFDEITITEFLKRNVGAQNVVIEKTNMFELRRDLASKMSDIENYLAIKKKVEYKTRMLENGCTLSVCAD